MMNAFRVVLARSSNSIHHHNNFFVTRQHARQATSSLSTSGGIPQSAPTTTTATKSARSKFKEIPVNPSILKYVQNVGVGIPKRNTRKRRLGKRRKIKGKDSVVLGRVEELEQFGRIRRGGRQTDRTRAPPPPFSIPSRFSSIESNTNIIRHPVKLLASIGTLEKKLPRESKFRPEVVLAGRSNVGKSTLLNSLLYSNYEDIFNQKRENDDAATSTSKGSSRKRRGPTRQTAPLPRGLKATTSAKPGETRQINFYQLSATVDDSKYRVAMLLVDLPGYGFAYASEDQAKQYRTLMENYILDRGNSLKRLLLLIDARHGMKKTDIEFIEALQDAMHSKTSGGQQSSSKVRIRFLFWVNHAITG